MKIIGLASTSCLFPRSKKH